MNGHKATVPDRCPNCGAPVAKASRPDMSKMYACSTPTIYKCGSVASPDWSPPLIYCVAVRKTPNP